MNKTLMWTDGEGQWWHVPVLAVLGVALLLLLLRIAGKRTVAKFNMYDMIVTFTIGSILSSLIVLESVGLDDAVLGLASIIGLDALVSYVAMRSSRFRGLIKAEPALLVFNGEMQRATMRSERVVEEEIVMFMRQNGIDRLSAVTAMVLESNGEISVFTDPGDGHDVGQALERSGVDMPDHEQGSDQGD